LPLCCYAQLSCFSCGLASVNPILDGQNYSSDPRILQSKMYNETCDQVTYLYNSETFRISENWLFPLFHICKNCNLIWTLVFIFKVKEKILFYYVLTLIVILPVTKKYFLVKMWRWITKRDIFTKITIIQIIMAKTKILTASTKVCQNPS